jgi:hypothetical protein
MQEAYALSIIAEVGAAFMGFIVIFTVLSRRDGKLSEPDSLRARALMNAAVFVTLLALSPIAVYELGVTEDKLWRIQNWAAAFFIVVIMVFQRLSEHRAEASWLKEVGVLTVGVAWVVVLGSMIVFVVGGLELFGLPASGLYLLGLITMLSMASLMFLSIVTQRLL